MGGHAQVKLGAVVAGLHDDNTESVAPTSTWSARPASAQSIQRAFAPIDACAITSPCPDWTSIALKSQRTGTGNKIGKLG